MNCGCSSNYVQCCNTPTNCSDLCNSFVATNSWNIPAIGANAVLNVTALKQLTVGTYVYHPSYNFYLKIVSFDATLAQITVTNDGTYYANTPGVVVPAATPLTVVDAPSVYQTPVTSFTPVFIPTGGMTFTPSTIAWCQYRRLYDDLAWINLRITGVLAGVAANSVVLTLPIPAAQGSTLNALIEDGGSYDVGQLFIGGVSTTGTFYKRTISNYTLGNIILNMNGVYNI